MSTTSSSDATLQPVTRFGRAHGTPRGHHPSRRQGAERTVARFTHALMLRSAQHLTRVAALLSIGYAAVVRSMADERRHLALRLTERLDPATARALGHHAAPERNPRTPDRWRRIYVAAIDADDARILDLVCDLELEQLAELRVLASTPGLSADLVDALTPLVETLATDCYLLDHLALTSRQARHR